MDLKDFVVTTLASIINGVREAQSQFRSQETGVFVNPQLLMDPTVPARASRLSSSLNQENLKTVGLLATNHDAGFADIIEFDVALTVESKGTETSESEKKAGGGLKVYVASAEANLQIKNSAEAANSLSQVTRIKFRVPVQFPRAY